MIATAKDGEDAVAKARLHHPDVITLDVELSRMDELEALHTDLLERSRRTLGSDHRLVARALNDLAMFLTVRRGRMMEARKIQVEALRIWRLNY